MSEDAATARHRARGKLTARERVDLLVDPGAAFLELNALAAWDLYDGRAPSVGIVIRVLVAPGDAVTARQPLVLLEAMKLETPVTAPFDGTVDRILVTERDHVPAGALVAEIRPCA